MKRDEEPNAPVTTRRLIALGSLISEINRLELTAEDWAETRRKVDQLFELGLLPMTGVTVTK